MFSKGVPEKLIAEKTGHRSLKALRFYERTKPEMERALNEVIADPTKEFSVGEKPTTGTADKCIKKEVSSTDTPTTETADKCVKKGASSTGHSFSGNLTNCTINISYN